MNSDKQFNYSYSTPSKKEQEQVEDIRSQYLSHELNKMEQLQQLDQQVKRPGTIVAIILGVVGALVLGGGLSMTIMLPHLLIQGIVLGVAGMVILGVAYPVYNRMTKKRKKIYSTEIFRLSDELLQQ